MMNDVLYIDSGDSYLSTRDLPSSWADGTTTTSTRRLVKVGGDRPVFWRSNTPAGSQGGWHKIHWTT